MSLHKYYKTALAVLFVASLGFLVHKTYQNTFGAGYRPVTNYDARITSFLTAAATSINVNTTEDKAGNEITLANISPSSTPNVYFTVEPGITGQEELIACTAKSTGVWSSCIRGLNYQGGDLTTSSTLAKAHNAGSRIIMTNIGQFYSEFLSRNGAETKYGVLTFDSFPITSSSAALPTAAGQLANKLYVDNVGAGGFTASNVSTTLGLQAISSGTPNCTSAAACVGMYVSSTASDDGGFLNFGTSTNNVGRLFWDVKSFLSKAWTWLGVQTFNTTTTFSATTTFAVMPQDSNGSTLGVPVGTIVAYSSSTAPTGWLIADGTAISRTTYSALYGVLGTFYGVGDGVTTFNLPDTTGRTIHGASSTVSVYDTMGEVGGSSTHIMVEAELAPHTHVWANSSVTGGTARGTRDNNGSGSEQATESTGSGTAFDIKDPYIVMRYIIKY